LKQPFFSKQSLLNHSVSTYQAILKKENLEKFLQLTSASYDKIRSTSRDVNKLILPNYEKYEFNPLFRYPIIESDPRFINLYNQAPYIVPNVLLLIKKIAYGVYWDLREIFNLKNSRDFLAFFGDIFNLYVGKILINFFGENKIKQLPADLSIKIADWIIITDDLVVIFECKSQLLPYMIRKTFNEHELKTWLDRNIIAGIEQLFSTEDYLLRNGLQEIKVGRRKIYKILITYEQVYFIESPLFKNRIIKYAEEKQIFEKYRYISDKFYIMSIHELELMQNIIKKFTLREIFAEKELTDVRNNPVEGNNFINIYNRLDSEIALSNDWLEDVYSKYFDSLIPKRSSE